MSRRDYHDDVIAELADSEGALREQVMNLAERAVLAEADRDAMRLVTTQALHQIHDLQLTVDDLRTRYHRALDDARRLRGQPIATDKPRAVAA